MKPVYGKGGGNVTVKSADRPRHALRQFSGPGDKILMGVIYAFLIFVLIVILIPIINIIASSFSSSNFIVPPLSCER